MASTKIMHLPVLTLLLLAAVLRDQATAQSSCGSALTGMAPCLNYVTGNSPTPSSSCCSQLSNVVQSSPQCLCSVINGGGGSSFGVNINQTLALQLPTACKVQTPPVRQCNAANNGPTTSPADTPVGSPPDNDTPDGALTPSESDFPSAGTGSKTVPSINGGSSDTNINAVLSMASIVLFLTRI